ncbi:PAS domain-containing protein [bacterium]|nr:PAS domain-containing protein [bacterium]
MNDIHQVNILIVDDHMETLDVLEAVLKQAHYNIVKATSGEEALRWLLRLDFALILLDVKLPTLSGFEVARLIRQREKNRYVPIIFITGVTKDAESISQGYLAGAVDYLMKPVDPDILRAKVSFFIDIYIKQEALKQAGKHFTSLYETGNLIVWRADARTMRFQFVSREAEKILGYPVETWLADENFFVSHLHTQDNKWVISSMLRAAHERIPVEIEYRLIAQNGETHWFHNVVRVPKDDEDSFELIGIMLDVSERKEAEEAIRLANEELERRVKERTVELEEAERSATEARSRYQELVEGLDAIVWEALPRSLTFIFVSSQTEYILGYPARQWTENPRFWRNIIHPDDRDRIIRKFTEIDPSTKDRELEYRVITADGRVIWMNNIIGLYQASGEHNERLRGIMIDITERKRMEGLLKKSVAEKDLLLKEIHHRVKNNLQIISSLLNLQKNYVSSIECRSVLDESQNRVHSMALIHEKLYQTENLNQIHFAEYIRDLSNFLFRSYGVDPERVKLNVDSQAFLTIDTAIPCGLIVSELVSNALKYAFPQRENGAISIETKQKDGVFELKVQDDGVGFPENLDFRNTQSLGMRLVNTLAKQLQGSIEMNRSPGTIFRILFPSQMPAGIMAE